MEGHLEQEKEWDDCLAFKPHHLEEGQLQSYFFQGTMSIEEYKERIIQRYSFMTNDTVSGHIVDPFNKITYAQDIRGGLQQEYYNKYFESHMLPFLLAKYEEFISMPEDSKVIISSFRDFLCGTSRFTCNREQYIHCGLDTNTLLEHLYISEIVPILAQRGIPFVSRTQARIVNLTVKDFYQGKYRILQTLPKQYDLIEIMIEKKYFPIVSLLLKEKKGYAGIKYEIITHQAIIQHVRQESKRMRMEELDKS